MMKFHLKASKTLWVIIVTLLISSTAHVFIPKIWREISDVQAKKQSLKIPSWAPLVERAQPAVVVITTEAMVAQTPLEFPDLPGPFRFFMPMPPEKQRGQGSGFIINEDGYILTNHHVIDGAQKIKIKVGLNPKEYDAELIGGDEPLDIALLRIKTDPKDKIKWPFLPLGNSDAIRVGDPIMVLGSPLGLIQSVAVGIVSAKYRRGLKPSGHDLFVDHLMQLSVSINPGNSGGPVLDDAGQAIAVAESMLASGQNIAFGLPINMIKTMLPQLMANGQIERAYLGVEPMALTPQYARALGISEDETGAVLIQVMPNTPAEKAGLKAMDVILEIDGQKVIDDYNLRHLTAYKGIGQIVKLKVFRKGNGIKILSVKLEKRPGQTAQLSKPEREKLTTIILKSIGLEVSDTPEVVQKDLGLSQANPGVQIIGVARKYLTDAAAPAPGDVIIRVDGTIIASAEQFKKIVDKAEGEKTFMMLIRRGHAERLVSLTKQ